MIAQCGKLAFINRAIGGASKPLAVVEINLGFTEDAPLTSGLKDP
jgi:hypothetical protein